MAKAPTDLEWRKTENIYYSKDLRKAFKAALEEAAPALTRLSYLPLPRPLFPPPPFLEDTKGPGKTGDQGHGMEVAKGKKTGQSRARPEDKGKGKEAAPKAKESEPTKPQAVAQEKKADDPPILPSVSKEDPPPTKA